MRIKPISPINPIYYTGYYGYQDKPIIVAPTKDKTNNKAVIDNINYNNAVK